MKACAALVLSTALLVSCRDSNQEAAQQDDQPTIAAVNYPLAYFAERLAGDFATLVFEVPPGVDPAFWKPSDEEIARIQQADLILMNGANYAKWASTTSLPFEALVDTSESFSSDFIEVEGVITHAHGKDDPGHTHGGTAFTTWMDLKQASAQAAAVANAIVEEWPGKKEAVMRKLAALHDDLKELDRGMAATTAKLLGAPVIASHPVYQYWERAYGLKIASLPWEPEMELDDQSLADLGNLLAENPGAKFFLWEGDPRPGHAEKLKALGLTSLVISPCANRPERGDFLTVMQANLAALEAATL